MMIHVQDGKFRRERKSHKAQEIREGRWEIHRQQKKSMNPKTNKKAKIDKYDENRFFGKSNKMGHLEESMYGGRQGA